MVTTNDAFMYHEKKTHDSKSGYWKFRKGGKMHKIRSGETQTNK